MTIGYKTLKEYALNPDGVTYNGRLVAAWLYHMTTGKELSEEDLDKMMEEVKDKVVARKAASVAAEKVRP